MKFSVATALTILATAVSAIPVAVPVADAEADIEARGTYNTIKFEGAGGAYYYETFKGNGVYTPITNGLSVVRIVPQTGAGSCEFHGKDGSVTYTSGTVSEPVGPPQAQSWGSCAA